MNQLNNQKLFITSKRLLLVLRILFVILILMAILPWVAPSSKIGDFPIGLFLMGMFGVPIIHNFNDTIAHFNFLSRVLGFIGSIINLLPLLIGTIIMMQLSKSYAIGKVFTLNNVKSYNILGVIFLSSAILLNPLSQIVFSWAVSINHPVDQKLVYIHFDMRDLSLIFLALVLIIIGQIMKLAQKINEEQEFTV